MIINSSLIYKDPISMGYNNILHFPKRQKVRNWTRLVLPSSLLSTLCVHGETCISRLENTLPFSTTFLSFLHFPSFFSSFPSFFFLFSFSRPTCFQNEFLLADESVNLHEYHLALLIIQQVGQGEATAPLRCAKISVLALTSVKCIRTGLEF